MEFVWIIFALVWIMLIAAFVRLQYFYYFMKRELDAIFHARINGDRTLNYPNVDASYKNLKWWDVWNYNFKSLIVYDKD